MIGPFPQNMPQPFTRAEPPDFNKRYAGSLGTLVSWMDHRGDTRSGRVDLARLTQAGSPAEADAAAAGLGAFGYAEVNVDRDCTVLLDCTSSGPLVVNVNEKTVYPVTAAGADHPASAAQDIVRCNLVKGRNRIVVVSRQGAGPWFFAIGVAPLTAGREKPAVAAAPKDLH